MSALRHDFETFSQIPQDYQIITTNFVAAAGALGQHLKKSAAWRY
jgi:hypothetical protein